MKCEYAVSGCNSPEGDCLELCIPENFVLRGSFSANAVSIPKQSYYMMSYYKDGVLVGKLDFNGPELKFTGNANESAKVFIDSLAEQFAGRLQEERRSALEEAIAKKDAALQACVEALKAATDTMSELHHSNSTHVSGMKYANALMLADEAVTQAQEALK